MEQASSLLLPLSSDFSTGTVNFDTLTHAPGDCLIMTTVEEGLLTEIAADGDFIISKSTLLDFTTSISVVVGGSDSISLVSSLTFSISLRFSESPGLLEADQKNTCYFTTNTTTPSQKQ